VDFDLSPDGAAAAVTFGEAGSLALVDLEKGSTRVLAPGRVLERVRFRSDGRALMAGDVSARSVLMLEPRSGRTIVDLPLAVRPDNFCVKADGGQLFVTGEGMDGVVFVYPFNTEVSETVLAGRSPGAMTECLDPNANLLFVANSEAGEVSVIELETRRVIAVVTVGRQPSWIGMTPDQQYALVLNRASGDMAVIRVAAIAARRTKSAPLFTMIPVGSGPVSLAVRRV
jgi:YVTN family beta-propeller protein